VDEYAHELAFIERMRALGAVKVAIGHASVEFGPLVENAPPEAPVEETEAEAKQRKEALLYGSSG
jgi:hypothetical protein